MSLQLKVARQSARGDPGILGDLFKGVAKIGTGLVSASGIPVISGVAKQLNMALQGGEAGTGSPTGGGVTVGGQEIALPQGAERQTIQPGGGGVGFNIGGRSGITFGTGGEASRITGRASFGKAQAEIEATPQELKDVGLIVQNGKVCNVREMRPNKTGYFTKDGVFHPPGSKLVKIRKMNALNPRAMRKSIRRVKAGKRWEKTMKQIRIVDPKCPAARRRRT